MAGTSFDGARVQSLLRERDLGLGKPLTVRAVTGSTNDDAAEAARAGAPHGATFVADSQTQGRGRRGASWTSPPGENLLCSVLLRPELAPDRASALTLAVGLAVREVIATRVVAPVGVKWPNDVVASGKKVAGILVESQIQGTQLTAVIVGVGVNVAMRELPEAIAPVATSLALLGAQDLERERLLVELLAALERRVDRYLRGGLGPMLAELEAHDALRGRQVRIDGLDGIAEGIGQDGALLVRTASGELARATAGVVQLL